MQKMGIDHDEHVHQHSDTGSSVGSERDLYSVTNGSFSGPLTMNKKISSSSAARKSNIARFNIPPGANHDDPTSSMIRTSSSASASSSTIIDINNSRQAAASSSSSMSRSNNNIVDDDDEAYVEITLDVREDSVAVHSVKTAGGVGGGDYHKDDPEMKLLAKTLEKRSSFGSSLMRTASSKFIKQVSQELRRLASINKRPTVNRFDRTKSAASHALKGLKFISSKTDSGAGWVAVDKKFNELTSKTNGLLHRSQFGECIGMDKESKDFALELFDALARRRTISGDSVNKAELKEFWDQISDQSFDSRLQTFFDMVDKDADGRITEKEVKEIISASASANSLSTIQNQAEEYAALIMEELDPNNLGYIMIESLEMLLLQAPMETARGGDSRILSQMLSQKLNPIKETNSIRRYYQTTKYFILDNWQRIWVIILWLAILLALFTYKFIQYRNRAVYDIMGYCVCTAKGAAETLKFNMALILLPVCRNTITWLRNKTKLGVIVPFDDNLNFHKVIAIGIGIGVVLHGGAHLTCDFPCLLHASEEEYEPMKPFFGEDQPENYWWFVKGVEGVTGILMVVLMGIAFTFASPWFRRNKIKLPRPFSRLTGFNMFWYSHHLFIIVYALLIVHGIKLYLSKEWYKKTTWMYLAVPVALYTCERLIRALRSSIKPVKILKVAVYPGNVLALHMSKPQGFRYKSGQYMFVNCAAVSPFEWHPFSITSAPGEDYLSVHIRAVGDWTKQLKTVFSQVCQPPTGGKSGLLRADFMRGGATGGNNPAFPRVLIDGPYGAPAQDYKKYEVVLLVGLGIGATPMISILKDIINNTKAMEEEEEEDIEASSSRFNSEDEEEEEEEEGDHVKSSTSNNGSNTNKNNSNNPNSSNKKEFKTRRAYFYWTTREQGSFNWFKGAMNEVAEMDKKGVIELHNYCTSVYEEGDARSALIAMLQSLNHAKCGIDVVSGTRVKTHFAKPKWRNVYKRIAINHRDSRVGVFYCGPPGAVKELRELALDFSHKTSTKFDFHKENF